MAAKYPSDSDRLEDVFQDEVVNAFASIVDFKKFARSGRGLCLDDNEIESIIEDNQSSVYEQKIKMLLEWKQNKGASATAFDIRSIIKKFKNQDLEKANAIVVFDHTTRYLQSYKPSTNIWTKMQSVCNDVGFFTPVVLGENIYVLSGKKMYRLKYSDPTSKYIELQGTSENHGWIPSTVAMNGSIYVCGGSYEASDGSYRSLEKYDVASNKWKRMPDMKVGKNHPIFVAAQGFIYIISYNGRSVERFNVEDRSFEEVEQVPRSIVLAKSVELEGTLYVADEDGIQCYNIENKSWKTMELVQWPEEFLRVNIHAVDDELYVVFTYNGNRDSEIHKLNHKTGCLTLVTKKYYYVFIVALRLYAA